MTARSNYLITIAVLGLLLPSGGCSPSGFTDADLENIKKSIKEEFAKRDEAIKVKEVVMMRESAKKATGFIKIEAGPLGEIMKSCSATMDEKGTQYIWRCD